MQTCAPRTEETAADRKPAHPAVNGQLLRTIREKRGLTRVALAKRVGVSQSWISRIERDSRGMRPDTYLRLCAALDVAYEELLRADVRPDEETLQAARSVA